MRPILVNKSTRDPTISLTVLICVFKLICVFTSRPVGCPSAWGRRDSRCRGPMSAGRWESLER
jgi:hypothetical protein